jgi:hypothetical protein
VNSHGAIRQKTTASTTGEGRARLDLDLGDDEPLISPETTHQKIQEISEKAGFNAVRRAAPQSNQKESIFISRRFSQSAAVGAALKPDVRFRSTLKIRPETYEKIRSLSDKATEREGCPVSFAEIIERGIEKLE